MSPRHSREASGHINLSVTTWSKERGQASKTQGLPPCTWWASPFLLREACPARACSLLTPALAWRVPAPRRQITELGEGGVVPEVGEGGHQLYGNEGLAPPPAPPLTWVQLLLPRPPSTPQPSSPKPPPASCRSLGELSWIQSWLQPLESQGEEGLRPGRPGFSPHRARCRVELEARELI